MGQFIEGAGLMCVYLGPFFGVLAVGGIVADYVLPGLWALIERLRDNLRR